jgi:hypothetical protein
MKTLIFADNEFKMNMDKTVAMRVSRNLDTPE